MKKIKLLRDFSKYGENQGLGFCALAVGIASGSQICSTKTWFNGALTGAFLANAQYFKGQPAQTDARTLCATTMYVFRPRPLNAAL